MAVIKPEPEDIFDDREERLKKLKSENSDLTKYNRSLLNDHVLSTNKSELKTPDLIDEDEQQKAQSEIDQRKMSPTNPLLNNPDLLDLGKGDLQPADITAVQSANEKQTGSEESDRDARIQNEREIVVRENERRYRESMRQMQTAAGTDVPNNSSPLPPSVVPINLRKIPGLSSLIAGIKNAKNLEEKITSLEKLKSRLSKIQYLVSVAEHEKMILYTTLILLIPSLLTILLISLPLAILAIPLSFVVPSPMGIKINRVIKRLNPIIKNYKNKLAEQAARREAVSALQANEQSAANEPMSDQPARKAA